MVDLETNSDSVYKLTSSFNSFTITSPTDEEGSSAMPGSSKFGFSSSILEAVVPNPLHS